MRLISAFLFCACGLLLAGAAENDPAVRVIVVANANDPDSLRIARHYAAARNVPVENIIALPMPLTETISWREFVLGVWQPLQDELVNRKWIDAIPMKLADGVGRRKYIMSGHRISYLVTCRGVPLRIDHDPALVTEVPPLTDREQFRTNCGAVDSELSLLAVGNYNINAFVVNPLFLNEHPSSFEAEQIIKVSRLDGPATGDVLAMIDRTLQAEANGLMGRAYVDLRGPHKQGEAWLESVAQQLDDLNFDLDVNRASGTLPASARFDAPVLYFGWYAGDVNGPFNLPGFRLPPGAIALHIHSYSAHTLRSTTSGWCGPLIARGASATFGAVFEPYLELMHQPQLLLRMLAKGNTLGDAAYYSLRCLSWQNIVVGDPLYRPFAVKLSAQWSRHEQLPVRLEPYVTLREMRRLQAENKPAETLALARTEQRMRPSLAVGVALARWLADAGDSAGAAGAIGFASMLKPERSDEWALLQQAAILLEANGRPDQAVEIYRSLFKLEALPGELRAAWLREASRAANAAHNMHQAIAWERQAMDLAVPMPKK
ncbi:MAG: TIGR03790 family protein [Opitutaceae bacterium]|nr:TIGR03790 family protein [Opitutaceae bacterium]MBP9911965.1 TIGR03790 family protein [Opitutaceae bacterium]